MTNSEKFYKIFGIIPDPNTCIFPQGHCDKCKYTCSLICTNDFWNDEFKEVKE